MRLRTYDDDGKRRLLLQIFGTGADHVLDTERVVELRDALTAWIDAPRLAARQSPEVVANAIDPQGFPIALWRTPFGEWAIADSPLLPGERTEEGSAGEIWNVVEWHTGAGAELRARRLYATERGKVLCECGAEVDADDAVSDEGGGDLCPTCAAELRAEWLVGKVRCRNCDHTDAGRAFQGSPTDPDQCPRCGCEELEAVAPATLEISGEQVAAIDDGTAEEA